MFNTFDFDGVIYMGDFTGVFPTERDFIVTGRSFEELDFIETYMIKHCPRFNLMNIKCNQIPFNEKTREKSAEHKVETIRKLEEEYEQSHGVHFEDDPLQIEIMRKLDPKIRIVFIENEFTKK